MKVFWFACLLLVSVYAACADSSRPNCDPIPVTASQLLDGEVDYRFVRITGTIRDVQRDELNSDFRFFIIDSGKETVYAPSCTITEDDEVLKAMIGAEVSVCGTADYTSESYTQRQFRRNLYVWRLDDIQVIKPAPKNAFDVPELENLTDMRPAEIPRVGRRRVLGRTLAVWGELNVLIETREGSVMRLELDAAPLPAPGSFVEAAGIPETDIYRINLTRAVWREATPFPYRFQLPVTVSAHEILTDSAGRPGVKPEYHGRLVRISGVVRSFPDAGRFYLEDGSHLVLVDIGSFPNLIAGLSVGCQVMVVGICVMNIESWRPTMVFPRTDGFTLVPRSFEDIEVLSHPPWWTPGKFLVLIGILVAAIAGILSWNWSLQWLARKRGRELYRAQIAKSEYELRIGERTRLAVELHDTISQNLTGISMHIGAAENFIHTNQEKASRHLGIASYALDSCRGELRNCIWDLRNGSLDGMDMNTAIRDALAPYIGERHLAVRFSVRRSLLSDKTAHILIQIVRELAVNAIRHGHADTVRIAGANDGLRLRLSVTDDGDGFDPALRPGVSEGHFGLQGIRERLKSFEGELSLESAPGQGAKAVVTMVLPDEEIRI